MTTPATYRKVLVLLLPFPSATLSPNGRFNWHVVANAKKAYREACRIDALQVKNIDPKGTYPLSPPVVMDVTFYTPRKADIYDIDGLISRMKSGIDGIVSAGILADDNAKVLTWGEVAVTKVKANQATCVVLSLRSKA